MALEFLIWELLQLEQRVQLQEQKEYIERRVLRNLQNPIKLHLVEFIFMFRLSPELAIDLINSIRHPSIARATVFRIISRSVSQFRCSSFICFLPL